MLSIISMNRAGLSDGCLSVKVDFEFDNASTLPERVITVSGMSYIIAKDSTAKNTVTNVNYKYTGSKWVKVTETVEPVTSGTITDNGDYIITNNEYTGLSDISVNVAGGGGETFEVEIEVTVTRDDTVVTVDKTYQQIKSEIDLGKTISGTLNVTLISLESSGELSISYVEDFYYETKVVSDAIFIVTEPFQLNINSEQKMSALVTVIITPDNKLWASMTNDWVTNPET